MPDAARARDCTPLTSGLSWRYVRGWQMSKTASRARCRYLQLPLMGSGLSTFWLNHMTQITACGA